jgi:hypothetical protein
MSVAQIKLKMAHLIWLLRGIPGYVVHMFKEYSYWKGRGKRGFIEFEFFRCEQVIEAIRLIEELPVYEEVSFAGMPGTPSYAPPGAKQLTLPQRKIAPEVFPRFHEVRLHETVSLASLKLPPACGGLHALYGEREQT